jgi:protocatechuate 3,4-dioxygenase beta subunit
MTWRSLYFLASLFILGLRIDAQEPQPAKNTAKIHAVFVDSAGKPITGVEFVSRCYPGAEFPTTSDSDGRVESKIEWQASMRTTWYEGYARCHGYALWHTHASLQNNGELDLGRIKLEPGGTLTGRVLDQDGKPLANAFVRAIDASVKDRPSSFDKKVEPDWTGLVDSTHTSTDGRFRLLSLPPGRYWVIAKHESTWRDASSVVQLAAHDDVALAELRLEPLPDEMRIEGTVLGPNGEVVSGAKVWTIASINERRRSGSSDARTDDRGSFVLYLPGVPTETVDLNVEVDDRRFDMTTAEGVAGGSRGLVIRMGAMRDLHVRVVDPNGKPVEHYGVMVSTPEGGLHATQGEPVASRADGRVTLRLPDAPITIEVNAPGFNRKRLEAIAPGPLPELVEVRLDAPSGVQGTVIASGAPVAGCHVELVSRDADHLQGLLGERWSGLYYGAYKNVTGTTDAQGHFMIASDFPNMKYYVRAWKEGFAEGISGPTQVGGAPVVVELASGGTLEGRVQLPNAKSPAGIAIALYRREGGTTDMEVHVGTDFSASLGADGKYRFEHLAAGAWFLRVKIGGTLASDLGWDATKIEGYVKFPYLVSIEEGKTTGRDLDLSQDDLCRLDGRLTVGDRIREGYAYLLLDGRVALQYPIGSIERTGSGVFHLATRDPGRYRCVVVAGPGREQWKIVTDLVDLHAGVNVWEKDVPIASWVGKGVRLDAK